MRTNFFSTPLKPFDPASETWPVRGLFEAFSNREFETAGIETLLAFVQSGLSNLTPDGLVSLLPKEEGCDGDARIDLVYTPSYATAAAGMYLLLTRPSAVDEKTEQELQSLMNRAFANGIPGHGYGADRYRREVLFMFALAGAKQFLEKHPDFCPGMADALNRQMELVKARPEGESDWTNLKNLTDLSIRTLAAWEGNTEPVFVYGTLMQGQSAHAYMDGSTFAGKAILRGFAIYNLGWYPGIVPTEKEAVFGELYYISKSRLPEMDRYEGVGSLYERKTVPVETRYGKTDANAYIYLKELPSKPIEDGRWESRDSDPVWYACYGSNLNEECFKDYILGNEHPKWGSRKDGCHDKTLWQDSAVKEYPVKSFPPYSSYRV